MIKHVLAFVMLTAFVVTAQAKSAKLHASWEKTLNSTATSFQSAVNDVNGMLVTTLTTNATTFATESFTYAYYDKKNKEKFTGSFEVKQGEDLWVQAIDKTTVLLRRVAYATDSFTKLAKDYIETYKLSKKGAKLLGSVELPLVNNYYTNISFIFSSNKVAVSVVEVDAQGTQTNNYVNIYDVKLGNPTTITGGANSNLLSDSKAAAMPKYWIVKEKTTTGSYPATSTSVMVNVFK